VRCVYTVLYNENKVEFTDDCLGYLTDAPFLITGSEFLIKLNNFKGISPLLTNVLAAVRQFIMDIDLIQFRKEPSIHYLIEWIHSVINIPTKIPIEAEKTALISSRTKSKTLDSNTNTLVALNKKKIRSAGGTAPTLGRLRSEIDRSVRTQVLKLMDERAKANGDEGGTAEVVENLRYELVKMQQELLKRKVLNPLHYKAISLDNVPSEVKLNVPDKHITRLSTIATQSVKWGDNEGLLEICLDIEIEALIFRFIKVSEQQEKQVIAYVKVDKLEYNRITGLAMDDFLSLTPKKRTTQLQPILTSLINVIEKKSDICGRVYLHIDRNLYRNTANISGIAVDIVILRNPDSTGILIHCSPLHASSLSHGIITVFVSDVELVILLINQRSLFTLAQSKWSCMVMVSTWLSNRLIISKMSLPSRADSGENISSEALQITINRVVEIADVIGIEWRHRNVPRIPGIQVELHAIQDLELLRLEIKVIYTETREVVEAQQAHQLDLLPSRSASIHKLSTITDIPKCFIIPLLYRLSGPELIIFGKTVQMQDSKVSLGSQIDVLHPSAFMWNVFSRLCVHFNVSIVCISSIARPLSLIHYFV
jgi:hypothetical protein